MMRATLDRCKKIVGTPGGLSIPTEEMRRASEASPPHNARVMSGCRRRAVHTTDPWVTNRLNLERQCVSVLSAVKRFLVLTGNTDPRRRPEIHAPSGAAWPKGILIFRSQTRSSRRLCNGNCSNCDDGGSVDFALGVRHTRQVVIGTNWAECHVLVDLDKAEPWRSQSWPLFATIEIAFRTSDMRLRFSC